ncbi:hypothetical protein Tco_0586253 [Tanacetum coccineum]
MLGTKQQRKVRSFQKQVGFQNPKRFKKAIAAQPKMYHGEMLHSVNLKIDSPDSEETLEDAKESRLKMRNKMVQLNYGKLNALYEIFVPQQEPSVEQTYFSIPSTSNNGSESKKVTSDLPIPKMPKESVESSNSVRRPKSNDTKSKDRVLKNNNDKRPSAHVLKMSSGVSIDSNKRKTMHSNCKKALFTTPIVAKSKNLGATSVVAKSRLSVAKTPTTTNKVSSVLPLIPDSSQSRTLNNYMKNKIATSRKWKKWFENQQCFNWTTKSKTAQSLTSETKSCIRVRSTSNTPVTTQKWVAKLSTLPSAFFSCDAGDPKLNHFGLLICGMLEACDWQSVNA